MGRNEERESPKFYAKITGSDGVWVAGYLYLKPARERVTPADKLARFVAEKTDSVRHVMEDVMDEVRSMTGEVEENKSVVASIEFTFDVDGEKGQNTIYLCSCGGYAAKGGCNRCGTTLS